jgi:hypothetical protein
LALAGREPPSQTAHESGKRQKTVRDASKPNHGEQLTVVQQSKRDHGKSGHDCTSGSKPLAFEDYVPRLSLSFKKENEKIHSAYLHPTVAIYAGGEFRQAIVNELKIALDGDTCKARFRFFFVRFEGRLVLMVYNTPTGDLASFSEFDEEDKNFSSFLKDLMLILLDLPLPGGDFFAQKYKQNFRKNTRRLIKATPASKTSFENTLIAILLKLYELSPNGDPKGTPGGGAYYYEVSRLSPAEIRQTPDKLGRLLPGFHCEVCLFSILALRVLTCIVRSCLQPAN